MSDRDKYCINCKWFDTTVTPNGPEAVCNHRYNIVTNYVTGEERRAQTPAQLRHCWTPGVCAILGNWFEPKV